MYYVKLNQTYSGTVFRFVNFDEAANFMGVAIEYGTYTDSDGNTEPVKATMWFEEEVLN